MTFSALIASFSSMTACQRLCSAQRGLREGIDSPDEMLISLAPWLIISMLISAFAKLVNIRPADPMALRILRPTRDKIAMSLETVTSPMLPSSLTSLSSRLWAPKSCIAIDTWD
jgi:hypothetical protein